MQNIGKLGVWAVPDLLSTQEIIELAQGVENLGYSTLWYPEGIGFESLSFGSFVLSQTNKLCAASGIANIYARDAVTAISGHNTLNKLHGDRFILGLGVSHVPLVEDFRGHTYGKPVTTMRKYLDIIENAELTIDVPDRNIVLAALGPNMLALARDRTKGAHPYLVTPEHTRAAREILGPKSLLLVEQKVCLTTDPDKARQLAADVLKTYLPWPNYRNNWLRLGFTEEDLSGLGSPRFLDAMVAWGTADTLKKRINEHLAAGADHVCIQALHPAGNGKVDWKVLELLADI